MRSETSKRRTERILDSVLRYGCLLALVLGSVTALRPLLLPSDRSVSQSDILAAITAAIVGCGGSIAVVFAACAAVGATAAQCP